MKLSAEVLTYIQTVKNFLNKNEESKRYFLTNVDEDIFFERLGEIAQKNFDKNSEPMLSKEQFDSLRTTMKSLSEINKSTTDKNENGHNPEDNIFIDYRGLGKICLN